MSQSKVLSCVTRTRFHLGRVILCAFTLIFLSVAASPFLAADKSSSRPTVRIAAGNSYDFCEYAAGNGNTYGPNCKLKIDDVQKAWADVSNMVIDGIFEIKRSDPTQRAAAVFVVNKLTIENGGKIVTNGNTLYIFANEFVATVVCLAFSMLPLCGGDAGASQGSGATANPGVNGSLQLVKLASMSKIQESFKTAVAQ